MSQVQSLEERVAIVNAFEQSKWWPKGLLATESNLNFIKAAIDGVYLDFAVLTSIFNRLIAAGSLQFVQNERIVEEKVYIEVDPRTPQEIKNDKLRRDDALTSSTGQRSDFKVKTEFDRLEAQRPARPYFTQEQLRQIGIKERADAALQAEADSIVRNTSGQTHAQRQHNREAMNAELKRLRQSGISAAEVVVAIRKKSLEL